MKIGTFIISILLSNSIFSQTIYYSKDVIIYGDTITYLRHDMKPFTGKLQEPFKGPHGMIFNDESIGAITNYRNGVKHG